MTEFPPLGEGVLAKLRGISTATLTTQLFRRGFRQQFLVGVKPLNPTLEPFVGEAFTLRFIPSREDKDGDLSHLRQRGENNMQWEAVEAVGPGQVLVIDSREDSRAASAGNMLITRLMRRGAAAIVTDGAFRDGPEIAKMPFPAYCRTTTASTRPSFHRAADMQLPIGCAQVAVYPGDVLVGDGDGVVVVPRALAPEIADDGAEQELLEQFLFTKIDAGAELWGTYPADDETLAEFEDWKRRNPDGEKEGGQ